MQISLFWVLCAHPWWHVWFQFFRRAPLMSQPRRDPAGWHLVRMPGPKRPAGGTRASPGGASTLRL